MRARRWAVGAAVVLLAGGLVAVAAHALTACRAGGTAGPVAAREAEDVGSLTDTTARDERELLAALASAGVPAVPRWALWSGLPGRDGDPDLPEVVTATVAGDTVVTVQESRDERRLAAGYALPDGVPRWATALPPGGGRPELLVTAAGPLVVTTSVEVSALDPATGRVLWCTGPGSGNTTVQGTPAGVLVAAQDGADSNVRLLDPGTGDERWSTDFESHDGTYAPAVAGGTASVYAVDPGGRGSGVLALDLATGEPAWKGAPDYTVPVGAAGDLVLLRSDAGLQGVDARTGALRWISPQLAQRPSTLRPPDGPGDPVLLLRDGAVEGERRSGVTAVDPATGAVRWELDAAGLGAERYDTVDVLGAPGGRLVLRIGRERLATVDGADGRVLGNAAADAVDAVDVVAGDHVVTIGGFRTRLLRLDPAR